MTPDTPPAGHRWTPFSSTTRPNLYSALALHFYHDANTWKAVRDEIRCKYTHHWIYSQSPEYGRCRRIDEEYQLGGGDTSNVPEGHPAYAGAILRGAPTDELLALAADALDVQIMLAGGDEEKRFGPIDIPECRLWIEEVATSVGTNTYNVSLLEEDGTGAALSSFLDGIREKQNCGKKHDTRLPINKLTFCWKSWLVTLNNRAQMVFRNTGSLKSANEYQGDTRSVAELYDEVSKYPVPKSNGDASFTDPIMESHEVYTLCISDPMQISAAVDLLFQALEHASVQGPPVKYDSQSPATAPVKPYVGVDAGFIKRDADSTPHDYRGSTHCKEFHFRGRRKLRPHDLPARDAGQAERGHRSGDSRPSYSHDIQHRVTEDLAQFPVRYASARSDDRAHVPTTGGEQG